MGTSTNGQICYGIAFEEEFEFPWSEHSDGIEDWWILEVHGFKHSFELFTSSGDYLNGVKPSKEDISRYFEERREFEKLHPMPIKLVTHCSSDYPMHILAVPNSYIENRRGFPLEFDPKQLLVTDEETNELMTFCRDYGIKFDANPQWFLTSYWG